MYTDNDASSVSTRVTAVIADPERAPLLVDGETGNQEEEGSISTERPSTDLLRYSEDAVAVTVSDNGSRDATESRGDTATRN